MGLNTLECNTLYMNSTGTPRTCIIIKKHLKALILPSLSNPDLTVVMIELAEKKPLIIASAYMPHDEQATPAGVEQLIQMYEGCKTSLLLGCDANCRQTVWGSSENNDRGESLIEYILPRT